MKKYLLIGMSALLFNPIFSQNVGIGTNSPSYKLQIEGDTYVNGGWLRVSGSKGLLFEDYGGGWYMQDATWIRTHGSKSIYHNSGIMRTDGTLQVGNAGGTLNVPNGGNLSYRTDVLFANTSGNVGIGTASPSYKLDVSGTGRFTGQLTVPLTPSAAGHAASKQYVDNLVGAVTETDPTWSGAANTSAAVSRTGNITVGDITVTGDDINSSANLRLNTGNGYIDFRSNHSEHGLIIREHDGSGTSWGGIRVVDSDRMEFRMDGGSYGGSLVVKDDNNVGIGNTSPSEKLHVTGNILASGGVYWGNSGTRTQTRNDAGEIGTNSGFYETSAPVNFPPGASSWWHLIDTRHSSNGNNYAMQIAGSFFNQELWFRKTNNNAASSWSKIMSSNEISGTTNYVSKFTGSNEIGNSQIYDNGTNVGIGTASPSETLDVHGDFGLSGKLAFRGNDSYLRLNQDGDFTGGVYTPGHIRADGNFSIINTSPTFYFRDTDNPSYMIHANSDRLYVLHGATNSTSWNGNRPLTIFEGNKVGINNASPSYELHVSGRIKSNGINETSDIRFKKEIENIENSLDKVMQLRGVSYYWRTDEFPAQKFNTERDLGLIAQEVESIIPEIVHTDNEGYKSVQYSHLAPVLVEAIKEQQSTIDAQRCEIEQMKNDYTHKLAKLNAELASYQAIVNDIKELDMEALKTAFAKKNYSASK